MNLPLWTLLGVLALIAFRRVGALRLAVWQIVLIGALLVLGSGDITPAAAWRAIDWEVIGFLLGVFLLGQALVESGLLQRTASRLLLRVRSLDGLVLGLLFAGGGASALLMNDTLAVIGTPLVLGLARAHRAPPLLLLLALAFGITIGSAMSPIGNPQNLLIALSGGLESPFLQFFGGLGAASLLNLLLAWGVLRIAFRGAFPGLPLEHAVPPLNDPRLARLAAWGLGLMLLAVAARIALAVAGQQLPLWTIATAAGAPVLLGLRGRPRLLTGIDWHTLIFFAALFVLVQAVWDTGALQNRLPADPAWLIAPAPLLAASCLGSQLVSNVPLVALALPLIEQAGGTAESLLALAAGSTIAGNLTLMGAASNIIILQAAERRGERLGFWRFAAIGAPLTLLNLAVYNWLL